MNKFLSILHDNGLIIGGFFMLIISLIILRNGLVEKQITKENNKVIVKVIDCYKATNNSYFIKFELNKRTFTKRTKAYHCKSISNNKEITLLTNKQQDRFIFLDELEKDNDFVFSSILSLIAIVITFKGFKQKTNE